MSAQFMQYLLTGLTVGAIYALVALGFSIIFNASHVINFAQGEFVMIGGMATVSLTGSGLPYLLAIPLAVALAALVGLALEKFGGDADHHHHRRVDFSARAGDAGLGQESARVKAIYR
jgi:branched-chain amino acid transport system permease protein